MPLGPTKSQQTKNQNISAKNEPGWHQGAVKGGMLTRRAIALRVKDGTSLCHTRYSNYGDRSHGHLVTLGLQLPCLVSPGTTHNLDLCPQRPHNAGHTAGAKATSQSHGCRASGVETQNSKDTQVHTDTKGQSQVGSHPFSPECSWAEPGSACVVQTLFPPTPCELREVK